jgi:uncharacterized protein (DUF1501 family)
MYISRRKFLQASSLCSSSLLIPRFLKALEQPENKVFKGKILILIQLSGGNDGLNTIIPTRNDLYYKERPRIGITRQDALTLTDEVGIHPSLTAFKGLYDEGQLAILNSVGYPNPDRSHFRSMDIWHSASSANEYWNDGWIGRYLDAQCAGRPTAALEIDDSLSLALKGAATKGLAFQSPAKLRENTRNPIFQQLLPHHNAHPEAPVDYLYKTMAETLSAADYLYEQIGKGKMAKDYPNSELGRHFQTISSLILSDSDTSIYYVSLGSFDTHIAQENQQKRLFTELNDAIESFVRDMKTNGRWNEVLLGTFSEFGRRVSQNASGGTDHGTANNMMFLGGGLKKPGLLNLMPDLSDLQDGDLKYRVDFRQAYATLLKNWIEADPIRILRADFEPLGFV